MDPVSDTLKSWKLYRGTDSQRLLQVFIMQVTRLYLIRHGQVFGHENRRYNGQGNVPLTDFGKQQARVVSDFLYNLPLAAVYCSDLDRCIYGAQLITASRGFEISPTPLLRELDAGDWEGCLWEDLQRKYPAEWQARLNDVEHYRVPGGESLRDLADRVRPVLRKILRDHAKSGIALVAHGGVNRIVLLDAIGAALDRAFAIEQDYGCLNIIDYRHDGSTRVRLVNGGPARTDWPV